MKSSFIISHAKREFIVEFTLSLFVSEKRLTDFPFYRRFWLRLFKGWVCKRVGWWISSDQLQKLQSVSKKLANKVEFFANKWANDEYVRERRKRTCYTESTFERWVFAKQKLETRACVCSLPESLIDWVKIAYTTLAIYKVSFPFLGFVLNVCASEAESGEMIYI